MKPIDKQTREIRNRVSDAIQELANDSSYNNISKQMGINKNVLYSYRDKESTISIKNLVNLCKLTGKDVNYYIYGKEK